jgi:hypothetical protein
VIGLPLFVFILAKIGKSMNRIFWLFLLPGDMEACYTHFGLNERTTVSHGSVDETVYGGEKDTRRKKG